MAQDSLVSVIVCTKNRPVDVLRFLSSLESQTCVPDELIIVDASDTEETASLFTGRRSNPFSVRYIESEPGLTRQRNRGIREAKGDYVCFFDDDVVLDQGYLAAVIEAFDTNWGIGGVTGMITNAKGPIKLVDRILPRIFFLTEFGTGKMKPSGFPTYRRDANPANVEVLSGCNMAYSKEVVSEFCFDENLTGYSYMEDVDFSYRVSKRYRLVYQPKAKLEHFPTSYRLTDSRLRKAMLIRNQLYLTRKNFPKRFRHAYAVVLSIMGQLLYNLAISKDLAACRGVFDGVFGRGRIK